ncbi:MAG: hypothetical protein ACFFBQ_17655, partial [Promethearchaeota archaeon]
VGNSASDTITCTEDGVSPSISITGESESSVYLYAGYGTGIQGVYGSLMASGQSYVISGTASDATTDLLSVEDDTTTFGGNPSQGGTLANWQFDYQITSTDNGDVTITYTATDNVGNTNTVSYTFYEDNTDPTLSDPMSAYQESGDTDEVYGIDGSDTVYFSNSFDSSVTITFTATGSDTGPAGVRGVDFGIFGADNPVEDTSSPYQGQYTLDNADTSGTITVAIYDNVGNSVSDTITCTEDATIPILSDAMSAYSEDAGDTTDVFGDIIINTLYFSNSIPSSATVTFTATGSDTGGSGMRGIDFSAFGDDDPTEDTSVPYQGQYILDNTDTSGSITVTIYDNVGNSASDTITCTEDGVNPSISITGESESSVYLYAGYGTGTQGVYGSLMSSGQSYVISGTASDATADLLSVEDDTTTFGGNPSQGGTLANWQFDYQITSTDNGDVTITYTATDNVGNTNTVSYTFYEDNTDPTLSDPMSAYQESGDTDEVYGIAGSDTFYFSNSFDSSATITFTATGSDTGPADVRGIDFGVFGTDNPVEDTSAPYQGQYTINDADVSGTITVTIYDNVGNSVSDTITCTEDATDPNLSDPMSAYSEDTGDISDVFGDITTNTLYFSNSIPSSATVTFTATGSDTGGSGIRGIDFSIFGDDNPAEDTSAPFQGQYAITNADVSGTITVTIYDNVGNSVSDTITCTEDATNPTLSDAMSVYAESGDTDEVHGDETINTFYFSNSFGSSATVTFTATGSDTGGSGMRGIDFGTFGGDDPAEDPTAPYQGQYTVNDADASGTITVTIYDNVGNLASDTITCTEDGVNPSISITGESESSVYLYAEYGTGTQGAYGSLMSSGQSYVVSGIASDATADLLSVEDNTTTFGGNPSQGGTLGNWQFDYQITSTDNGDVTITYTATDNVGNTNTASYTFYEDNTNPTLSDAMSAYDEFIDISEVYGVVGTNTFYFSNSFSSSATVEFTATGSDSGYAGLRGIDFGTFGGDNPPEDPTSPYQGQYTINNADVSGTITVTVYDNVGNSESDTITCTEDVTNPTLSDAMSAYSEDAGDTSDIYGDITINTFYFSNSIPSSATVIFTATGSDAGGSGIRGIDFGAFGGDDPVEDPSVPYQGQYTIINADASGTIIVTVYDNVGNSDSDTITCTEDATNPTLSDAMSAYQESGDTDEVYGDDSINTFYFSDSFDTSATITFTATGSDASSGIRGIDFGTFGGDDPAEDLSAPYTGQYSIDGTDTEGTITVIIYDNVGNSASDTITCTEDAINPTLSDAMFAYQESGDTDEVYGIEGSNTFYFSNSFDTSATITLTATGSDASSGVRGIDFGTFGGDNPAEDSSTPYTGQYSIDGTDTGGTITVIIYDNVGNSASDTITCTEDATDPTLSDAMSAYQESGDTDKVYGVEGSNTFYFSGSFDTSAIVTFTATGSDTGGSGMRGIDFGAFGGDDPAEDPSAPFQGQYTLDNTDTSGTITVAIYDNVGNSATDTITCDEDSTSPSAISLSNYLDLDDTVGDGYTPSVGYKGTEAFYDEDTFVANVSVTETGSGIYTLQLKRNGGSYGTSEPSGINANCTLALNNNSIWYRIIDNVGNVAEDSASIDVFYSTTAPNGMDIDITNTAQWTKAAPSYAWILNPNDITSGTLYLGNAGNTNWGINMDASGNWNGGGAWKVIFEAGWGQVTNITVEETPYSSGPVYSSNIGNKPDIWVDIVNRNGVKQRITLTTTADTLGPSMDDIIVTGDDGWVPEWDQNGAGFIIDFYPTTDAGSGPNGWYVEYNNAVPRAYWITSASDPYSYTNDVGDGSANPYTFYAVPVDKVGNIGADVRSDDGYIDETDPELDTTLFTNFDASPNWYDQGSTGSAIYRINFTETNVFSISVTCTIAGADRASDALEDQTSPFDSTITLLNTFADGEYQITIILRDKSGRNDTIVAGGETSIRLDNTEPNVEIHTGYQIEGAYGDYLYWDGTKWWYGDDMGANNANFTVGVTASDPMVNGVLSNLSHAIAANNLGGSDIQRTDDTEDTNPTYNVPVVNINSTDTWTGTLFITVYDLVGNSNTTSVTIDRDVTAPSGYSLSYIADSADQHYMPNDGYYDDPTIDIDATDKGSITETGSGLPNDCYTYQINTAGYQSWSTSDTAVLTAVINGTQNLYVIVRDNVGNNGTEASTSVIVDTTSPSKFVLTMGRVGALYPADFDNSTIPWTIKFNSQKDDYFYVTLNSNASSSIGQSGYWKIEWDKNSVFETAINESIAGVPSTKDFYYVSDTDGNFIIRLINNAGNYQEWNITAIELEALVTLIITAAEIYAEAPYLYHDGVSNYGYYSNNTPGTANFIIRGTASSSTGIMQSIDDNTDFGDGPPNSGSVTDWEFNYTIDSLDGPTYGTFTVVFTGTDDNLFTGNTTFQFRYDITAPRIDLIGESESSIYLYSDYGDGTQGAYGSLMSSGQSYVISGTASDIGSVISGLASVDDDKTFGGNPGRGGTLTNWQFDYQITSSDNGNVTITYTATDNVGNTNATSYSFYEDNDNPTISVGGESESSPYLHAAYGTLRQGIYSSVMGSIQSYTISGTASDTGSVISGLVSVDDDTTTFGNNPLRGGTLANWEFIYQIDAADNGDVTITYTATDNVANTFTDSYTFFEDNDSPIFANKLVKNPSNSLYVYINGTSFYFSNQMGASLVEVRVNGTVSDTLANVYSVSYTTHFGDSPSDDFGPGSWEAIYTITGSDPEQTGPKINITVTATDNVGNTQTTKFTFKGDNTAPSISLTGITEDALTQYLYNATTSLLYYSTLGSGFRNFTVMVFAQETLATLDAGLKNVSFPNIFYGNDGGFNSSSGDSHAKSWKWAYSIPTTATENGSYTITVYDQVNNSKTIEFELYRDMVAPTAPSITNVIENSEYLYYNTLIFYYSNDQVMSDSFTIQFTTSDAEAGLDNAIGSTDFGGETPSDTTYIGGYELTYTVNQSEHDNGDDVVITVYDKVGNSNTKTLSCVLDNTNPSSSISAIVEASVYIYYNSPTLYYSNDQSMAADFTIQVTASDDDAGLLNATGEDEFDEIGVFDTSYTTNYELTYQINQGESTTGGITVWIYDQVGNSDTVTLACTIDNAAPIGLTIEGIVETSDFIYYDVSREILFYSNDQPMSAPFTIRVSAEDSGAGRDKATGEDEFGETGIEDTTYTTYYELTYTIDQYETASDDLVSITVFDRCANNGTVNLNTTLDNVGPRDQKITQVNDFGSKYIHLYNGTSLILFVSNQSTTDHLLFIYVSDNEPNNESGRNFAVGGNYFGESPTASTYFYVLSYTINTTDNVENGTLTIWTFDKVNNSNSVDLEIYGDLTSPALSTGPFFDDYGSDFLHDNTTHFFFSNLMPTSQTITISGIATDKSGGSGIDRVSYQAAFGSTPSTTFGASWSANYGIDSTDSEHGNNGSIKVTFYDRVNNSREIYVNYVSDTINPIANLIEILEDLLPEYLLYNSSLAAIFYSHVRPDKGNRKFTVKVDSSDNKGGAGLRNASFPSIGTGFSPGGYDTEYTGFWSFSYTEDGSSGSFNGSLTVTVYDNVANSDTVNFNVYQDFNPPTGLSLVELIESSEFLYYASGSETFYYSNTHVSPQSFTINITGYDPSYAHSGLFSANGSLDFGETHSTTIFDGNFALTYAVGNGETASGNVLAVTIYDNVGNSAVFYLSTILDNAAPTVPTIITVVESSEFLYYNAPQLFYSNDQVMSDSFNIQFTTSDAAAGLLNATGSVDFGGEVPVDTTYSSGYQLTYTVSNGETDGGDDIIITVYDRVGNSITGTLDCVLDNAAPVVPTITTVVENSEHLYYDPPQLYYSNNQAMSDSFTIQFTTSDAI